MPSAELIVQYHNFVVWTASKNDVDIDHFIEVDYDFESEQFLPRADELGLLIPVRSEFGPVTVTVNPDESEKLRAYVPRVLTGEHPECEIAYDDTWEKVTVRFA